MNVCSLIILSPPPPRKLRTGDWSRSRHVCDNLDETSLLRIEYDKLLQYCFNKLTTSCSQACYTLLSCLLQTCYNNLLHHCHDSLGTSRSTSCYKSVNKLLQVRHNKLLSAVRRHLVDKLLVQTCYKSAAGLLQLVRFYVCTFRRQYVQLVMCVYTFLARKILSKTTLKLSRIFYNDYNICFYKLCLKMISHFRDNVV